MAAKDQRQGVEDGAARPLGRGAASECDARAEERRTHAIAPRYQCDILAATRISGAWATGLGASMRESRGPALVSYALFPQADAMASAMWYLPP